MADPGIGQGGPGPTLVLDQAEARRAKEKFDTPRTHSHGDSQTQKTLMICYLHGVEYSHPKTAFH